MSVSDKTLDWVFVGGLAAGISSFGLFVLVALSIVR